MAHGAEESDSAVLSTLGSGVRRLKWVCVYVLAWDAVRPTHGLEACAN